MPDNLKAQQAERSGIESPTGSFRGTILRCILIGASVSALLPVEPVHAYMRRDLGGELHWSSAALQGAAGQGAFSESWVDQAHTDVSLLARRKSGFELQLLSGSFVISRDASESIEKTLKAFTDKNESNDTNSAAQSTAQALDEVRAVFGKTLTTQFHSNFISPRFGRFGIAPYTSGVLDASIDNTAWPKLDAYGGGYAGVLLSYAQTIGKDFDIGVALRPGVGGYRSYELDLSLFGDSLSGSKSSQSVDDLGGFPTAVYVPLDLAVGWWGSPSTRVHLVSKNTFDASPVKNVSDSPGVQQSRINLGFSRQVTLSGSKLHSLLLGGELQDLAGLKGGWNELLIRSQWAGRYTVRLPFREQTSFAVNAGFKSGYPVVSLFFDLFVGKIELALSARENGAYPGQRVNRLQTLSVNTQMRF